MVLWLSVLVLALALSGCGYGLQGSGSVLPEDVKNVYIPRVENDSTESGLGIVMTEALQDRFNRFGAVKVVESLAEADAVLNARIKDVKQTTSSVSSGTDVVLQQDSTMIIAVDLRRVNGMVLWQNPALTVTRTFGTTQDVVVTSSPGFASGSISAADLDQLQSLEVSRGQEAEVLLDMANEAAVEIYDQAVLPEF